VLVRNASTRLFDQYSQQARRRTMAAAAGKRGAPRAAPGDERAAKRQQQQQQHDGGDDGELDAVLAQLQLPARQHQDQQQRQRPGQQLPAGMAGSSQARQQLQPQQRAGGGQGQPAAAGVQAAQAGVLTARPNGCIAALLPAPATVAAGAGGGATLGSVKAAQEHYSSEQLMAKTNKELVDLLKGYHCRCCGVFLGGGGW
jgi:hypothetical protein